MKLSIKAAKANFFDRDLVIRAVGKARVRNLSKAGAFVRQRAKSSLKKRKRASPPGQPPSMHLGLIKQFLFFSYDQSTQTVVIGPALINKPTGAPETLEYGGDAEIEESRFVSGVKYGNRVQKLKTRRKITIAARPTMAPALKAEAPNFAGLWKNSVR